MHEPEEPQDDAITTKLPSVRPGRRRKIQVMAAVSAAAVVGASALLAQQMTAGDDRSADMAGRSNSTSAPPQSLAPEAAPQASAAAEPPASGSPAAGAPSAAPKAPSAAAQVPQPTRSPIRGVQAPDDVPATVSTYGPDNGQSMRVTSARSDLTGQREMALVGDEGRPVGEARCTQTFRFSPDLPPSRKPTMLLCWRITKSKSVYVITTKPMGTPSEPETITMLNKEWSKLG